MAAYNPPCIPAPSRRHTAPRRRLLRRRLLPDRLHNALQLARIAVAFVVLVADRCDLVPAEHRQLQYTLMAYKARAEDRRRTRWGYHAHGSSTEQTANPQSTRKIIS